MRVKENFFFHNSHIFVKNRVIDTELMKKFLISSYSELNINFDSTEEAIEFFTVSIEDDSEYILIEAFEQAALDYYKDNTWEAVDNLDDFNDAVRDVVDFFKEEHIEKFGEQLL